MNILRDRGALLATICDPATDPGLRALLTLRFEQLGGASAIFNIADAADGPDDAEAAIGWPILLDGEPCFEWSERHSGGWWELVFVLSDDGPAQVLLARDDSVIGELLRAVEPSQSC